MTPRTKKSNLKQQSQTVVMDEEAKQKFLKQLELQVDICEVGLTLLEKDPELDFKTFQRDMRCYIYDNGLEDKVPFRAVFNELYHVFKRFHQKVVIDKADRDAIYMSFYTYNFTSSSSLYDRDTNTLKINTPTLELEIPLLQPLPEEATEVTVEGVSKKTRYINLGYHRSTGAVTLDIFY